MQVTRLTICVVNDSGRIESTDVDDAAPSDVVTAVEALDGTGEIYLGDPSDVWLGVAGGPARYFVGYCSSNAGTILQALAEDPPTESIEFVIGGQPTPMAPQYLVDRRTALDAALHFLTTHEPTSTVAWDER
jgi:Immunity protein Imm1